MRLLAAAIVFVTLGAPRTRAKATGTEKTVVSFAANAISAHLIHSPLILSFPAVMGAAELGYEWLTSGAWRFAIGAGAGLLWSESSEGGDGGWMPWPVLNLRIGG